MLFRYDFGEKLDLTKFIKQATHYIGTMRELAYDLYLSDYKMRVEVVTPDNSNSHTVTIFFYEIGRDPDGELVGEKIIIPLIDTRFKELRDIKDVFKIDNYKAHFDSNSAQFTVEKICKILKILYKINNLKVFL